MSLVGHAKVKVLLSAILLIEIKFYLKGKNFGCYGQFSF